MKCKSLLFFIITIVLLSANAYAAAENEQERNKTTNIFYEIKKDGELKGYILGTMHNTVGHEKFIKISKELSALLHNVTTIYFEVELEKIVPTAEKALLTLLETDHPHIKIKELETISFQKFLLDQTPIICRSEQYLTPWHTYETIKQESRIIKWGHALLKGITNLTIHHDHLKSIMQHEAVSGFKLITEYLDESIKTYSDFHQQMLLFPERNHAWMEKILTEEELFCMAVGAGHLPGNHGMITLLEDNGFICTPINFIDQTFSKTKVKNYIHIFMTTYQEKLSLEQKETIQKYLDDEETTFKIWADAFFTYLESQDYMELFLTIKDEHQESLFIKACTFGKKQLVKILLNHGANPHQAEPIVIHKMKDETEIQDTTPLTVAVINGHASIVDLLLQQNVCIDYHILGFPLIDYIFGSKNELILIAALKNHISPNVTITVTLSFPDQPTVIIKTSPLHLAIINKNFESVKALLAYGADCHQQIDTSLFGTDSLLTLALKHGDFQSAQQLLHYGATSSIIDIQQCDIILQRLQLLPNSEGKTEAIKQFLLTKSLCAHSILQPIINQTTNLIARGAFPGAYIIKDYFA